MNRAESHEAVVLLCRYGRVGWGSWDYGDRILGRGEEGIITKKPIFKKRKEVL